MRSLLLAVWMLVLAAPAWAQSTANDVVPGYNTTVGCPGGLPSCWMPYDTTGAGIPVTGTFSSSIAAFAPTGQATVSATTTSGSTAVALGSAGPTAVVKNTGAVTAYINFGGSGVTATTSSYPMLAGEEEAFNVGSNSYIAGITGSSTATLLVTTGTGLPALAIAGSGGGGGGTVSISQVTPGLTNAVSIADVNSTTALAGAGATGAGSLRTTVAQDSTTVAGSASIPAGTNLMGKVGVDQTTPGTTNAVTLVAGGLGAGIAPASTAPIATQPALVVAISPNGNTVALAAGTSVIGVTGVAQASTTSGQTGDLTQGAVTTGVPTYTTGQTDPLSLTTSGAVREDLTSIAGTAAAAGNGTNAAALRVTVASDSTGQTTLAAGSALVGNVGVAQASTTAAQSGPIVQGAATTGAPTYGTGTTDPLSLDTAGNLRVNVVTGAVTATITGGATSALQSSVQTTVGAGTAPADANVGGCVYNSALPAPTSGQTMAIQCDASGRQILGTSAAVVGVTGVAQASATSGQSGNLTQGAVTTSAPGYTTGQTDPLSLTTGGALREDLTTIAGTAATAGNGTNANALRVTVASDSTGQTAIAQTTPGVTNGAAIVGVNAATALAGAGATGAGSLRVTVAQDSTTLGGSPPGTAASPSTSVQTAVTIPSTNASVGLTAVVSAATEGSHILKASAGNLYAVYATAGATPGFLMVFNATTAPADGAVTPIECVPIIAGGTGSISYGGGPPGVFSTGITAVFSSTGCFTKTVSATAFFHGSVD